MSDHFDGKKYFNPTLKQQFSPSFADVWHMLRQGRAKWPKRVEQHARPYLKLKLESEELSLCFVNHATFLIQFAGLTILTDPVWSKRASPFSWIGPKRVREPAIKLDELPAIDVVLISHNHYDHLDVATIKQLNLRFKPLFLVAAGDKALMQSLGVERVQELDWWENVAIDADTEITFAPTQHSSARGLFDRDHSLWGSFYIQHRTRSVYFGGDAGYSTHFSAIKNRLGAPEIALLGIGAYAPRFFMQPIHMNPEEAVLAHQDLGAKLSIGMHFGTFQLASESIEQPLIDLAAAIKKHNLADDAFITLEEGARQIYPTLR
jgi:L-ascorbate metabolism protein UlaG (beta-lactamase superfamily)